MPPQDVAAFDPASFCRSYGVGKSTFYELVSTGRLHARKVGRRTIILREDAEAWAAALPALKPAASRAA